MKTTVTEDAFRSAFKAIRPNNFSGAGLSALFEYLEQLEDDIGEQIEFDVIGICCDYSEYESATEVASAYGQIEYTDEAEALDYLRENTDVIEFDGGVIIRNW